MTANQIDVQNCMLLIFEFDMTGVELREMIDKGSGCGSIESRVCCEQFAKLKKN